MVSHVCIPMGRPFRVLVSTLRNLGFGRPLVFQTVFNSHKTCQHF